MIGLVGVAWADDGVPPRSKGALLAWLRAGTYRVTYVAEPAAHASAVHGRQVRTWYSPTLVEDLRAGRTIHAVTRTGEQDRYHDVITRWTEIATAIGHPAPARR